MRRGKRGSTHKKPSRQNHLPPRGSRRLTDPTCPMSSHKFCCFLCVCVCVGELCAVWGFDCALLHNYYLILINDLCNAAIKTWLCARIERLQKVIRLWSPCRWRFIESTNQRGAWVRYVEIGTTGINILLFLMGLLFASFFCCCYCYSHSSASSIKSIKRFLIVNNTDDLILRARWLDATRLGLTIGFPSSTRFSRLPAETSNKQTTRWARRVPGTNPQAEQHWVYTTARYSILIWRGWINTRKREYLSCTFPLFK